MKYVYWLKKGAIAGREGPDMHMWNPEKLKAEGFAAILSVNNGEAVHETTLSKLGIAYANIPMSPNAPIRDGDKELCIKNLPKAMSFIQDNNKLGSVLVHCRSGKDRTAMVLAAYLIEFEGYGVKEAMDKVISVRSVAFSAEGWMNFGAEVLSQYQTHTSSKTNTPA